MNTHTHNHAHTNTHTHTVTHPQAHACKHTSILKITTMRLKLSVVVQENSKTGSFINSPTIKLNIIVKSGHSHTPVEIGIRKSQLKYRGKKVCIVLFF